jgi:hypothetical protein
MEFSPFNEKIITGKSAASAIETAVISNTFKCFANTSEKVIVSYLLACGFVRGSES